MRHKKLAGAATLALMTALALPAAAQVIDHGDGTCTQSDGQRGFLDGTNLDDAGCITPDEYATMYSPDGLAEAGVITEVVDNGDGTISALIPSTGGVATFQVDPWSRPVAATPRLEPDAPTVGEYWAAWGLHPGSGGPQEF